MNQYYSEELSQKTKRGMNETRLKGNYIGGLLNYGYILDGNKIVINEEEAAILKQIFLDYASGKRLCDIVDELNDKGIRNRGNIIKTNSVYRMLGREKYTGIYKVNGETFDKVYPAIIPKDIYDIVRKRIDANKHGKHVPNLDYLLRGKVKCGYCGKALTLYTGNPLWVSSFTDTTSVIPLRNERAAVVSRGKRTFGANGYRRYTESNEHKEKS